MIRCALTFKGFISLLRSGKFNFITDPYMNLCFFFFNNNGCLDQFTRTLIRASLILFLITSFLAQVLSLTVFLYHIS